MQSVCAGVNASQRNTWINKLHFDINSLTPSVAGNSTMASECKQITHFKNKLPQEVSLILFFNAELEKYTTCECKQLSLQ